VCEESDHRFATLRLIICNVEFRCSTTSPAWPGQRFQCRVQGLSCVFFSLLFCMKARERVPRVTCHRCGMCNNVLSSDRSRQFTCQVAKMSSTPSVLCKGCKGMIWYSFWWARSLTLRLFVVQFTRGTNRYYQFLWRTSFILIFDILIWTYGTWLTTIDFKFCCGFFLVGPEVSSLVGAALSGAQPGGEAAPCPCSSTSWGT